jgi:hypothetical protein
MHVLPAIPLSLPGQARGTTSRTDSASRTARPVAGRLALCLCLMFGATSSQAAASGDASGPAPSGLATAAPERLPFASFFKTPVGPRGLEISPALQAARGQRVRLVGYMVAREEPEAGRFLLTPRPVRLSEHADGEADDLPPATVTVLLASDQAAWRLPHQDGLIELVGRFDVAREEGPDGRVSWFRLHLDADAVQAAPLAQAPVPHRH